MKRESIFRVICTVFLVLIVLPFLNTAYKPGNLSFYLIAGAVQAMLIGVAAWQLGRGTSSNRITQVAAFLLLGSWAVVSLALNMGDLPQGQDWLNTVPDQQIRYAALVGGAIICFGGLAILVERLRDESQTVLASLGYASITISTVLFVLLFLAYPILFTMRFEHEAVSGTAPTWWAFFSSYAWTIRLVHRLCAYLGTVLFVIALRRCGLIGRFAGIGVGGITIFVGIVSTIIHLPPAAAFVPPYLIGVSLLAARRKAGE